MDDRHAGRDLDLEGPHNVTDLQNKIETLTSQRDYQTNRANRLERETENSDHLRCKLAQSESSNAQYREALAGEKLRADKLTNRVASLEAILATADMEIAALTEAVRRLTEERDGLLVASGKVD